MATSTTKGKVPEEVKHNSVQRKKLIEVVKSLKLPRGEYVIFGGSCLVIRGLRNGDDVDIFVTKKLWDDLYREGWDKQVPREGDPPILEKIVQKIPIHVFYDWEDRDPWDPNVQELIDNPEVIAGLPFMPLKEVHNWKRVAGRSKDIEDIDRIRGYWRKKNN